MCPSPGCRLAFAQVVAAGPKRSFSPLCASLVFGMVGIAGPTPFGGPPLPWGDAGGVGGSAARQGGTDPLLGGAPPPPKPEAKAQHAAGERRGWVRSNNVGDDVGALRSSLAEGRHGCARCGCGGPVCSAQRTAAACSGGGGGHAQHSAQRTAHSAQRTAQPHGHGHHGRETRCTCTAAQATGANATPPSLFLCSMRRSSQQSRGALHFLNVPHINNRPLKTSLSYAKRKLNRRVGRQRQPFFFFTLRAPD
jgi:hypothetical protein